MTQDLLPLSYWLGWLEVNVNENMIRNLSSTLDISESFSKMKILKLTGKVVHNNKISLAYMSAKQ